MSQLINKEKLIEELQKYVPTPSTPDFVGEYDDLVQAALETFVDVFETIESIEVTDSGDIEQEWYHKGIEYGVNHCINGEDTVKKIIKDLKEDRESDVNIYCSHIDKEIRDSKYDFAIEYLEEYL